MKDILKNGSCVERPSQPLQTYPHILSNLRKFKNGPRLYWLWSIIYKHSLIQNTNQPWLTNKFLAKATGFGIDRIRVMLNELTIIKMLELIIKKGKRYIKINYLPTGGPLPSGAPSQPEALNAYRISKDINKIILPQLPFTINGITRNPPIKPKSKTSMNHPRNKEYLRLSKKFHRILTKHNRLNKLTKLSDTTNHFRLFVESDLKGRYSKSEGIQLLDNYLNGWSENWGIDQYCLHTFSATNIRKKEKDDFKISNAVKRWSEPNNNNHKENPRALKAHARNFDYEKDSDKI